VGKNFMLNYSNVECEKTSVVLNDFHCIFRSVSW
jgi:hypothetical protein